MGDFYICLTVRHYDLTVFGYLGSRRLGERNKLGCRHVHNAGKRQIDKQHTECDRQQEQRLKLSSDGEIKQETGNADH